MYSHAFQMKLEYLSFLTLYFVVQQFKNLPTGIRRITGTKFIQLFAIIKIHENLKFRIKASWS